MEHSGRRSSASRGSSFIADHPVASDQREPRGIVAAAVQAIRDRVARPPTTGPGCRCPRRTASRRPRRSPTTGDLHPRHRARPVTRIGVARHLARCRSHPEHQRCAGGIYAVSTSGGITMRTSPSPRTSPGTAPRSPRPSASRSSVSGAASSGSPGLSALRASPPSPAASSRSCSPTTCSPTSSTATTCATTLNKDLGFSAEGPQREHPPCRMRRPAVRRCRRIYLTAFISPLPRRPRPGPRAARGRAGSLRSSWPRRLEECEERDPKGLYKKARAGQIPEFTGYPPPTRSPRRPSSSSRRKACRSTTRRCKS